MERNYSIVSLVQAIVCAICLIVSSCLLFLPTIQVDVTSAGVDEVVEQESETVSISYLDFLKNLSTTNEGIEQNIVLAEKNKDDTEANFWRALASVKENNGLYLSVNILLITLWVMSLAGVVLSFLTPFFYGCNVASLVLVGITLALSLALVITTYLLVDGVAFEHTLTYVLFTALAIDIVAVSTLIGSTYARVHHGSGN